MGIVDKLKQGAEQAKTMAAQAAERAKEEARELNLKRQINNEEEQLGSIVVGLVERGEVSHAELQPGVERIKALRAELEELRSSHPDEATGGSEKAAETSPPEQGQ